MKYKAIVSFSGVISMACGEVGTIADPSLADDLLKAGYIIPYEAEKKPKTDVTEKPKPKRKGNANES